MAEQATLVIVKPDGLKKSLTGNILTRLSETRLKIIAAKVTRVSRALAERHYAHLAKKPFYEELVRYITGELHGDNRVMALVYWGEGAIEKIHDLAGATNPEQAVPTTIRGQYGRILTSGVFENVIHTSSEPDEAEREIKLWFEPHDIVMDLYPVREVVTPERKTLVWA